MTSKPSLWFALTLATSTWVGCAAPEPRPASRIYDAADAIYRNGTILTMTDAAPRVEAVAVKGGRIMAVGLASQVNRFMGFETRIVNLEGRTLLPGFVDSHGHVFGIGLQAACANLLPAPDGAGNDIASLQQLLGAWDAGADSPLKKYGWIVGFGYDDSRLSEQRHPNRYDLDRVSTDKPVLVIHQSGHLGVMNAKGLAFAGISASTPDPKGGVFHRKAGSREPDGVMEEAAFFQVLAKLAAELDAETNQALVKKGVELVVRYGYTTAQEGRLIGKPLLDAFAAAAQTGAFPIDVVAYPDILAARALLDSPYVSREYTRRFRIGGAKLAIDGSPEGKTAWLTRPYVVPPPGRPKTYAGYPAATRDEVTEAVDYAFSHELQLLTHANGDAAIDSFLAAVRRAKKANPDYKATRPVLLHGQVMREDQVDALKELGIFPSLFPMHTFYWGDWHRWSTLGPERAENISPTGWVRARGMMFGTHHDAPVALPSSIRVLSATVTRLTRSGYVLGAAQRVDAMTALKAMTIWPAWQHFEEATKGSIEAGKLADFVILSVDPTTIDPRMIDQVEVLETIKEGRSIYRR